MGPAPETRSGRPRLKVRPARAPEGADTGPSEYPTDWKARKGARHVRAFRNQVSTASDVAMIAWRSTSIWVPRADRVAEPSGILGQSKEPPLGEHSSAGAHIRGPERRWRCATTRPTAPISSETPLPCSMGTAGWDHQTHPSRRASPPNKRATTSTPERAS